MVLSVGDAFDNVFMDWFWQTESGEQVVFVLGFVFRGESEVGRRSSTPVCDIVMCDYPSGRSCGLLLWKLWDLKPFLRLRIGT